MNHLPSRTVLPATGGAGEGTLVAFPCPPDKSLTHRAIIFAALAQGVSRVRSALAGADCKATASIFGHLGVRMVRSGGTQGGADESISIESPGFDGFTSSGHPLDCANSGTTARLLTGLFSSHDRLFSVLYGDDSLSLRPMARVVRPLADAGAMILGRSGASRLPLAIEGRRLQPIRHTSDKASAQVKSALLLAAMNIDGESIIALPAGGRDHTERLLLGHGADFVASEQGGRETLVLKGPFRPKPRDYGVPGDPSSAAFFLALGAMLPGREVRIEGVLSNETRGGFVAVLHRIGADISETAHLGGGELMEPCVDVAVRGGRPLRAIDLEETLIPSLIDEIPVLAMLLLFADGESRLRGLAELRVKESDRLQKTLELIETAGGKAWTEGDDLFIKGAPGRRVGRFTCDPAGDHRLAMAAAVVGRSQSGCEILSPECVNVSFPGFFDLLNRID